MNGNILRFFSGSIGIPIKYTYIRIRTQINWLGKCNHPYRITLIELCRNTLIDTWIGSAVVPVFPIHIGNIVIVKYTKCTICSACIQRTVNHLSCTVNRCRFNMTAQFSLSVRSIDQLIFWKFCLF